MEVITNEKPKGLPPICNMTLDEIEAELERLQPIGGQMQSDLMQSLMQVEHVRQAFNGYQIRIHFLNERKASLGGVRLVML